MATLWPRLFISEASKLVTSDFPTPPLPDTTPTTCLMLERLLVSRVEGPASAVRSPQPDTPQLEHSWEHSSAMIPSFSLLRRLHYSQPR